MSRDTHPPSICHYQDHDICLEGHPHNYGPLGGESIPTYVLLEHHFETKCHQFRPVKVMFHGPLPGTHAMHTAPKLTAKFTSKYPRMGKEKHRPKPLILGFHVSDSDHQDYYMFVRILN